MRLIEKKCPNCGASLEFNDTDKSCKCQYCHRAFEIERDSNINVADIAEQFNLSELKGTASTAAKIFGGVVIGHYIIGALIGLFVLAMFIIIGVSAYKQISNNKNNSSKNPISNMIKEEEDDSEKLLTNASELSNHDVDSIYSDAKMEISHTAKGVNNAQHSYMLDGDLEKEKIYVAYKDGNNYLIIVLKGIYKDFFHQESQYTLYMPIVYSDVDKESLSFDLANGKLQAPEYHFGDDGSSYYYGYGSLEEVYDNVVKPYADEYEISEK
ncbi:MAG: hypothetical protein IJI22_00700 [Bacilli bacterium]|nr:hypothetical protein [Bacilli bacterium]